MSWAQLLKRVFAIDITTCPQCGGPLTLLATIEEPAVIVKISPTWACLPALHHAPRPASTRSYTRPNVPTGFRFSFGADTPPLPSSPTHTPRRSDKLARSKNNGPVRPASQDALPHFGQRSWGLNPQRGLWYFTILSKRPFKIPIPFISVYFYRTISG